MKQIIFIIFFLLNKNLFSEQELSLGKETIKPIFFSKFSLSSDVYLYKHILMFHNSKIHKKIDPFFSINLAFDTNLYKYFSIGGQFDFVPSKGFNSMPFKFALFLEPLLPVTDNFGFFSKIYFGIGASLGNELYQLKYNDKEIEEKYKTVVKNSEYYMNGFGPNFGAQVGFDYFPFKRMGIFAQYGFKADLFFFRRTSGLGPKLLTEMIYDLPVTGGIHIIL